MNSSGLLVSFGVCALALMIAGCSSSLRSESAPAEPPSAPDRVYLKSKWPDPRVRDLALAGGHPVPPDMPMKLCVNLTLLEGQRARPLSDYEAVERWLSSYGIKVLSVATEPNIRLIRASGTASQVEAALKVQIGQSANGTWFANLSDPQVPANLDGLISRFVGLDNLDAFVGGPHEGCV